MNCHNKLLSISILFLLVFICNPAISNHKIDSLLQVVNQQDSDTNRVKTFLKLSRYYLQTNPDSAYYFCNLANDLSDDLKYTVGKIDVLYRKSKILKRLGKYDSALVVSQKAIHLCDSINDKKRLANHLIDAGYLIMITDNTQEALKYYERSIQIYKSIFDSVGISGALNAMGVVHKRNANYDSAVHYYIEYLSLCEKIGYRKGLGAGFINLGQIYLLKGDFKQAEDNFIKSIELSKEFNRETHLAIAYMKLGILAHDQQMYDEALSYYRKAIEINKKNNNISGLANGFNNTGNIYLKLEKYDQSLAELKKASALYLQMGDNEGIIINLVNQAMIHEKLGRYDTELEIYDSCLCLLENLNLNQTKLDIYHNIYQAWELKRNFPKAYTAIQRYYSFNDSLNTIEKDKKIADIQLKYDTEKKEAKILLLENEKIQNKYELKVRTNQRNIYLFVGLGLIIIGLLLFAYYRQRVRKDHIIARQKIRQLEEEKKLLSAKALIEGQEEERKRIAKELHDGLGVILSTAKMHFSKVVESKSEDPDLIKKATRLLEQAATDVRRISHNMMPGVLTKLGLVEAIEDILDEINEIPGTEAIFSLTGEETRLMENTEIMLYRVIQEIINNTLKHAEASEIGVSMDYKSDYIRISISDNGKGFDQEEKIKSKSIGLSSIQSRVDFINGKLKLESSPGNGTSYNMIIPIKIK